MLLTAAILAVANLPYILAYAAPAPNVFSGILFNPLDGQTYLSKMRQGWRGEWLYRLPYTVDPGPGAFIFTYYLFLGHLARWTGASIEWIYHLARVLASAFFLLTAFRCIARYTEDPARRTAVWLLFALGSGLGWLTLPFGGCRGVCPVDFWVAEAFPFLTVFSNAHFPLAWALMLWLYLWALPGLAPPGASPTRLAAIALAATLAAQVQPMVLLSVGLALGGATLAQAVRNRRWSLPEWLPLAVFSGAALPWLAYAFWITRADPILAAWNAQNLTPSPPLWEALLAGGVPLLLAVLGAWTILRRRVSTIELSALIWIALGSLSLYAPFALQRRLSLGLWMPLVLLAAAGYAEVVGPRLKGAARGLVVAAIVAGAVLTNVIVYTATLGAVLSHQPALFLTQDEAAAIDWLAGRAPDRPLVVAAQGTALFIPSRSDARVIYGHPFETVQAADRRQEVEAFFAGVAGGGRLLEAYTVDYVFYGPREKALGSPPGLDQMRVAFRQGEVTIYAP